MVTNPWAELDDDEKEEERIRLHAAHAKALTELERSTKPKTFATIEKYYDTVAAYQKDAIKEIKEIKKRLKKDGAAIEGQQKLYGHQRSTADALEALIEKTTNRVVRDVKDKAMQPSITDEDLEFFMRMKFDEYRRAIVEITMGGGKGLTINLATFNDYNKNGMKRQLKDHLPEGVASSLDSFGRVLIIVPAVTHKKEVMKEGLDPVFAKAGVHAAALAGTPVEKCGLVQRACLLPEEVEQLASGVYVLDGGTTFNHRTFAQSRIVISTVSKICSEIMNSSFASTDFALVIQDEGDFGSHPCPEKWFKEKYNAEQIAIFNGKDPPPLEDQSWFTIQEFFYRAFLVYFTGTPAEWCDGYERFDGVSINPETLIKVTYGDMVTAHRAKAFNYVPMQPVGVRFADSVDIVDIASAPRSDRDAACKDPTPVLKIAMSHLYKRRKDEGVPYMSFLIAPKARKGNAEKPIVKTFATLVKSVLNAGVPGVFDSDPLCPAKKNMPSKFVVEAAYSGDHNSEKIMDRARKGDIDVLIIDSIGARGLDVALIGQIINFRDFDADVKASFNEAIQRFMRGMRVVDDRYMERAIAEGWETGLDNLLYNTITSPTRVHQYCDIIEPFNLSSVAVLRKFVKDNGCEFALRQAGTPMGEIDYQETGSDDDDDDDDGDDDMGVSKDAFLKAAMAQRAPRAKPKKAASPAGSAPESASESESGSDDDSDDDDDDDDDDDSDDDTPVVSAAARRSQEQLEKAKQARLEREKASQEKKMEEQRSARERDELARKSRDERAARRNNTDRTDFVAADIKVQPVVHEGRELLSCELPFNTTNDRIGYKYAMEVTHDKKASKKIDDADTMKWKFLENVKVVVANDMLRAFVPCEENIHGVRLCALMTDGEVHSGAVALSWKRLRKSFDKLLSGDAMDASDEEEDDPVVSPTKARSPKPVLEDHASDDCAESSEYESDDEDKIPYNKPERKKKAPPPPPAATDDDDDSGDDMPADAPVPPVRTSGGGSTAVRSFGGSTAVRSYPPASFSKPALLPPRVPNATTDLFSDDDDDDDADDVSVCNAPAASSSAPAASSSAIHVDMSDDEDDEDDEDEDPTPVDPPPVVATPNGKGKAPAAAPAVAPAVAPAGKPAEKVKFTTSYTGTGHLKKIADIMAVASPGLRANAYSLSFPSSTTLALKNEGIIASVAVGRKRPLDESQVTKLSMKRPSKDFRAVNATVGGPKKTPQIEEDPLYHQRPEQEDEARLTELYNIMYAAMNDPKNKYLKIIEGTEGTNKDACIITQAALKDHILRIQHLLEKRDNLEWEGQKALTHVAFLPRNYDEFAMLNKKLRNHPEYRNTSAANPESKKIYSFVTALRWGMIALGLHRVSSSSSSGDAFNLQKFALELRTDKIRSAIARAGPEGKKRFDNSIAALPPISHRASSSNAPLDDDEL
tara:strand:+ start:290 stop:4579 length:4290 start_codon:yes stop_codon:yes gene_type:complete